MERPTRSAKKATKEEPVMFQDRDVWVNGILPFLGPGHFLFIGGVCRALREIYLEYFATIEKPRILHLISDAKRRYSTVPLSKAKIELFLDGRGHFKSEAWIESDIRAKAFETSYRAAFSSPSCTALWHETTKGTKTRLDNKLVLETVARFGCVEAFKWMCEHNTDSLISTDTVCEAAARAGSVEILEYARKRGCPFFIRLCAREAVKGGHLHVLKHLVAKGYVVGGFLRITAKECGHKDIINYLKGHPL